VGTGAGQVIEALAPYFDNLIGVDPEMEMLEVAAVQLCPLVYERKLIRLFCSRIEDFSPPEFFRPHLTVFSRSFHWVEQDSTLLKLSEFMAPQGTVALMSDRAFERGASDWQQAVMELTREFLGEPERKWLKQNPHYYREWSDVLRASPFNQVEKKAFPIVRTWSYQSILGYLYSTSTASRRLFGVRADEFEARLLEVLRKLSLDDRFVEENEWEIISGRLP